MKIIKRGRLYWLDIRIDGKRHRVSLGTDEYGNALEIARDKAAELRAGPRAAGRGLTFADFIPRYLAWARDTKPGSYRTEACRLARIKTWLDGKGLLTLADVRPGDIEDLRAWVRERDGRTKPDPGDPVHPASKSSANRYCALLRKLYNRALALELYRGANPVSKVKFYPEGGKVRPLTDDELSKVRAAARMIAAKPESAIQRVMPDLIALAVNTGLRKAEALNLRWQDIRDDVIHVRGKGDKARTIPLNAEARAVIERQARLNAYVFDVPNRAQNDAMRRTVVRIRKLSGVPHFHFHLLRHHFTSALLAAGVDIETISRLCGHSRIMTTLIYSHSTPERLRTAVNALAPAGTKRGHSPLDAKKTKPRK